MGKFEPWQYKCGLEIYPDVGERTERIGGIMEMPEMQEIHCERCNAFIGITGISLKTGGIELNPRYCDTCSNICSQNLANKQQITPPPQTVPTVSPDKDKPVDFDAIAKRLVTPCRGTYEKRGAELDAIVDRKNQQIARMQRVVTAARKVMQQGGGYGMVGLIDAFSELDKGAE